jgi:hypothetical protein
MHGSISTNDIRQEDRMRSRTASLVVAVSSLALLGGCAQLQNVRVSTLPSENSSSHRSMLAQFTPLPWAHHESYEGALLRAPEDRGGGGLWYKPR